LPGGTCTLSRTVPFHGTRFLRALPGDRALLPPSPCGLKVLSSPVEPNEPPQDLTPASRRQDHTTSPSASSAVVLHAANRSRRAIRPALASHAQHCCVHRTPPRVRDDHDTPLWWGGMATVLDLIWVGWQQIFFGKSEKKTRQPCRPTGKSPHGRDFIYAHKRGAYPAVRCFIP
jgi:hypothetical protein